MIKQFYKIVRFYDKFSLKKKEPLIVKFEITTEQYYLCERTRFLCSFFIIFINKKIL